MRFLLSKKLIQLNNAVYAGGLKMKMLKQLKGKKVEILWYQPALLVNKSTPIHYRLEDYDTTSATTWIKLRSLNNPKQMTWYRFSQVETIGRVP